MEAVLSDETWEALFAPYDQASYRRVLGHLEPKDVVLDIGAGDLRLDRQMARIVQKVYAVEINAAILDRSNLWRDPLPTNLIPIHADARELDFPGDVTTGVLLMRHCTCFRLYAEKLKKIGAVRLITNARWRMDVEAVDLRSQPVAFADVELGWYACACGATGFKEGPAENWTSEMDRVIQEVSGCPQCE
jgi:SAM-dependent methyltransferase